MRQRRQCMHADKRRIGQIPLIWAGDTLEHPGRNLQPAIRGQSAQRAAEDFAIHLPDDLMDGHAQRRPRMPRVQKLSENDPVGVLEPRSTTASVRIALWATGCQHRNQSCHAARSYRGRARLRLVARARPSQPWHQEVPCTNIETGSPESGTPVGPHPPFPLSKSFQRAVPVSAGLPLRC